MRLSPLGRGAAALLAGLALFSLLFSVGHAVGLWDRAAPAGFSKLDLVAGFVFGIALLITLLSRRAR